MPFFAMKSKGFKVYLLVTIYGDFDFDLSQYWLSTSLNFFHALPERRRVIYSILLTVESTLRTIPLISFHECVLQSQKRQMQWQSPPSNKTKAP